MLEQLETIVYYQSESRSALDGGPMGGLFPVTRYGGSTIKLTKISFL